MRRGQAVHTEIIRQQRSPQIAQLVGNRGVEYHAQQSNPQISGNGVGNRAGKSDMPHIPDVDIDSPRQFCGKHDQVDGNRKRNRNRSDNAAPCDAAHTGPAHFHDGQTHTQPLRHSLRCGTHVGIHHIHDETHAHKANADHESGADGLAGFYADADGENGNDDGEHNRCAHINDVGNHKGAGIQKSHFESPS